MRARFGVLAAGLMSAMVWGCGGGNDVQGPGDTLPDAGNDAGQADAGHDAGQPDAGNDAGQPDAGNDGGTIIPISDAGTDGGTVIPVPDAGTDGGVATVPNSEGWNFLQGAQGLASTQVNGASVDEQGNLWVAGGTAGVFVMRKGDAQFQQFGLADGLHPYGYLPDGGPADSDPYLEALSVAGGPAGVAFVGYNGKEPASHLDNDRCESNLDNGTKDPAIYKSGDADKVSLLGNGVSVVHYDIFSGPGVVADELTGREKLCNIFRVVYEHGTNNVWFGANHGFAWGHADFNGDPTCNGEYPGDPKSPPHANCAGVWEHIHPAISGSAGEVLTGDYYGVALDLETPHDVWFGGIIRTTRFKFGTFGQDYYGAQQPTENDPANKFDVWPDAVPNNPTKAQRKDDVVSGIVAMPPDSTSINGGSIYVSSFQWGVRHLARDGSFLNDVGVSDSHVTALARDPDDGSIWVGHTGFGLGIDRIFPDGTVVNYGAAALGDLSKMAVKDIQIDTFTKTVDTSVKGNRVIISMRCDLDTSCNFTSGAVAIHQNP
jgi:hypothetical protein